MKNQVLKNLFSEEFYSQIKFKKVAGRYITNEDLKLVTNDLSDSYRIEQVGRSVLKKPIRMITFGEW